MTSKSEQTNTKDSKSLDDLEAFAEPESARLLGAAYLAERPHDGSAEKLMAHLKADLDLVAWYREGGGKAGLQQRLQARAAIDYGNDECLEAAGCYLSVTELRLCALSTFA